MKELIERLEEAVSGGKVDIDMSKYESDLRDKIEDLYDWLMRKDGEAGFDVEDEVKVRIDGTKKSMSKVVKELSGAIKRAKVSVKAVIEPMYEESKFIDRNPDYGYVKLYTGAKPGRSAPGFTMFGGKEVEDVLDAGDRDFFRDPELEEVYFKIVNEIRSPGSTSAKKSKLELLYTARPRKDRRLYDNVKKIPSGIYLTTEFDRAVGIAHDLAGSSKERDIYRVVIDTKYLVKTLDTPRVRDYQTFSKTGKVPIKKIDRI